MIYPIITEPNEILRKRAGEIPNERILSSEFQKQIDDMIETMYASRGIGIAAPQIGKSERVIIAETGEHNPIALVNPEITARSWRTVLSEEGCLSVPGVYGIVKRRRGVTVTAMGRDGKPMTVKNDTMLAIILQHEIDHLNGILFTDKAEQVHPITEYSNPRI